VVKSKPITEGVKQFGRETTQKVSGFKNSKYTTTLLKNYVKDPDNRIFNTLRDEVPVEKITPEVIKTSEAATAAYRKAEPFIGNKQNFIDFARKNTKNPLVNALFKSPYGKAAVITGAVLSPSLLAAEEAQAGETGIAEKAKSWPIEHPWLTGAGATGAAATTKKGRNLLGKAFRILGTPLSGLTWAGLNVRDKLKQGESITDAIIDPLTGLELSFPALFKENVAKITKSPTFQKALTLGKFGTKVMPGLGLGLTTLSAVRGMPEEPSYIRESKQRRQAKEDYYTEGEHFAGGGLANLTRTVAPDSGPMSQGLSYLYNRVKKQ